MDEITATSGSTSIHNTSKLSSMSSSSIFTNYPLICAFLAFAIAQSIKMFTSWYKERRWDIKQLVGSGGMPSSHSATVAALATAIGFQEGFGGALFAIALILACIILLLKNQRIKSSLFS
ncbi:hypothetical protein REPUB_Repub20aG0132100 [Reevesia pubescens]